MTQHAGADKKATKRALVASLIGTSIEWYDYFLYGMAASLVFHQLFFPSDDPLISLMLSYLTFALSFFVRPLGGLIFGHIGDRIGRKKTLILTLMMMGIATMLIGFLPDYHTIGIWAPIWLILLRLIQGLGIGGEWGGAVLLAVEYAPKGRRGFFGSVPQMGVPIGLLLGTFSMSVASALTGDAFLSWGWRIPFLLSAVLVFVGLWIRTGLDETPVFKETKEAGAVAKIPVIETFRSHWKSVLVAIGAKVVETAPFYIFSTFVIGYATQHLGFDKTTALNAVSIATLVTTLAIPYMGVLADRFGRKPLYIAGTVALTAFAFPYFLLLNTKLPAMLILATVIGLGIFWAPVTAVLGTLFSEVFSTHVRYTGVTIGYQLGAALAGGTAPLIATALLKAFHGSWVPVAVYMMITGLISLGAILAVRETKNIDLRSMESA